jgi:hypothetical protein
VSDEQEPDDLSWLQGPTGPDRVRFFLDVGENVEFTEEQRTLLEQFLETLVEEEEVVGHAADGGEGCSNYTNCSPKMLCEAKPICSPQSCNIINSFR